MKAGLVCYNIDEKERVESEIIKQNAAQERRNLYESAGRKICKTWL